MLVEEKKKYGFLLPAALADAFELVCEGVGKKEKWIVAAAAILNFLRLPDDQQQELMADVRVAAGNIPGRSFDDLLKPRAGISLRMAAHEKGQRKG